MRDPRETAAHLLALSASSRGETLREVAEAADITDQDAIMLARRTWLAARRGRNWREARAEAEARLRCGS